MDPDMDVKTIDQIDDFIAKVYGQSFSYLLIEFPGRLLEANAAGIPVLQLMPNVQQKELRSKVMSEPIIFKVANWLVRP